MRAVGPAPARLNARCIDGGFFLWRRSITYPPASHLGSGSWTAAHHAGQSLPAGADVLRSRPRRQSLALACFQLVTSPQLAPLDQASGSAAGFCPATVCRSNTPLARAI